MRTELSNIPDASSRRAVDGTTPAPVPHLIGVGVDGTSVNGLAWRGHLDVARREHRDLLVVGSSRQAEYGHATLGDEAAELLSHLGCPLAIAPRGMQDDPCARLEPIGVAFDGTPQSGDALALARSLAFAAGADLRVSQLIDTTSRRATKALQGLCAEVNLLVLGADPSPSPGHAPLARATRKLLNDTPTPILIPPRSNHAPPV